MDVGYYHLVPETIPEHIPDCPFPGMNVLRHETGIFMSHFPNELSKTNHIPIERGVSCGGTQVLFINFGVRTQKIRRRILTVKLTVLTDLVV